MTQTEVKQTLEDLAWLLEQAHSVPGGYYDFFAAQLAGLKPEGVALLSGLLGVSQHSLQRVLDQVAAALPRVRAVLATDISVRFAAFLRDAENRTLLINLIARWL